jgi:hypothetical protein
MPNVISALGLVKDGEKSVLLNLSNARQVDYDTLEEMTEAQKQGVIICPDYPLDEGNMIPASAISYGNGSAEDALDKSQAMIATVQPNLTAVKTYAKGDQFIYNGLLYIFTTSCAQGGTITINGNCTLADSVTEQINKSKIETKNITNIYLNDLTWSQDTTGMYFATIQHVTDLGSQDICIATMITGFMRLKATDNIQLYWTPSSSDLKIMSNVNSFTTNANISVRIAYIKN